ncbi:preprotein translocase subunit SecY [Legionella micdadei]|uniref:Protein translocase subunit SecY n=1 Tax=Legionella micdadei TaxID=451 RepID=A0A098GBC7_LEGMI|nr:preprotein translocase subunit SecY [Legionella micdadei]ARH01250.1 preprotein translocase subunit SecY [Legionella micdadei]KTD30283.1 preprotein translocase subunit SecY [Legionella micdadei]NSL18444.1 preprotein translocase subunit SecY [Legionella micdadei]CEG59803.1 Preprotein translocase subunit secY [Legionella micdadei]SCY50873.1 protein translocase subunit secY/sec61 alpha [Legionella micdadei]
MNNQRQLSGQSKSGLAELKSRLLFVVLGILIYRLGAHIPVPGLDPQKLANFFGEQQNTIFGLFNMFSGGALSRVTVFAIGIMPYISASIIIQLFSVVSPKLEQLKKEGESGRRKINQYTRYLTLVLAIFQSLGMARWLAGQQIALHADVFFYFTAVVTLVTGTMFLMWLGEQITEKGVGNGISLIIFSGIVSSMPNAIASVLQQVREGQMQALTLILIAVIVVVVTGFVVFMERAQRRIRVNYAQRTHGRKVYAAQTSHLPLKINMSGVIPPIFASSIILLPATLAQFFGRGKGMDWLADIGMALSPGQPLYLIVYAAAILFFAFFYAALVFNPKDTADNLKKSGAYIPGIRPGEQTTRYIDSVMTRLTLVGAIYLVLVCLLPQILMYTWHVPFYFGGTSLLIIVVVIMDFVAQVQAHLMTQQYDSLMKKANFKGTKLPGLL